MLRVEPDPQGVHPDGLANVPRIRGTIRVPVLSLHTLGDLFVPFSMEQVYARRVDARGSSDLLVTRAIRDFGHCGFTVAEQNAAFADLVRWVEDGLKPAGDDVLDPAAVAAAYVRLHLHPDDPPLRALSVAWGRPEAGGVQTAPNAPTPPR